MAREICYYAVVYLPRWSFWCPIALEPSAAFQCHNCAMSSVCQSHCGYSQLWYLPGLAFTRSVLQELCAVQWPAHKFTHKQLGITWRKIRCAWRLHHKFERQNHRLISYFPLWILYFFHLKVLQATTVYKLYSCSCVLRCAIQKTWLQERSFVAVWGSEYTRWPKDPKDYCARLCGFSQFTFALSLEAVFNLRQFYTVCSTTADVQELAEILVEMTGKSERLPPRVLALLKRAQVSLKPQELMYTVGLVTKDQSSCALP